MKIRSDSFEHGQPIPPEFALGAPGGFGGNPGETIFETYSYGPEGFHRSGGRSGRARGGPQTPAGKVPGRTRTCARRHADP